MIGRIGLAFALAAMMPVFAGAQTPAFLDQWWAPRAVGITFDPAGNVYIAKYSSPIHIDVRSTDGTLIAQWGEDGADPSAVTGPYYIAADAGGSLFVTEWTYHNHSQFQLQKFTGFGVFVSGIGFPSSSTSTAPGVMNHVGGVAVDAEGLVYVTDFSTPRTQVFTNDGAYLREWPSQGNSIALDSFGHAFEVEWSGVVRKYDRSTGVELGHWGGPGSDPGQFNAPQGIAVDSRGNVYVTDTYNHRVQVFDNDGDFLQTWGSLGSDPGQFYRPMGIAIDSWDRIYVADTWNGRVQIFGATTSTKTSSWGRVKRAYR